ncbi:MAG TPA: squalene/phytoene synthase family protein [Albidovulum sp.]|uniref:squalene/phytoene synthase family protein n=1 Tax=Albidovulum sp. TaxID=1872424 RepID=UPI002BE99E5C|nr:squalene/phytoene synthase family protein [Albidovulum sp.]
MSLTACAEMVEKGDPDRFAATMAAPPASRACLWPLYAANLEIARAPWASSEPMVAEMRLQWWIDTLGELARGRERSGHAVTEALAPILAADPEIARLLQSLAEARRWDCWRERFEDRTAFDAYLDATAGDLMWAAARALGAPAAAEAAVRDFAWGAGLAGWFRAAPELQARGRIPYVDSRPESLAALAAEGRARIARARAAGIPKAAIPALWTGTTADTILTQAVTAPARIAAGTLGISPFRKSATLAWSALTGRF